MTAVSASVLRQQALYRTETRSLSTSSRLRLVAFVCPLLYTSSFRVGRPWAAVAGDQQGAASSSSAPSSGGSIFQSIFAVAITKFKADATY